MGSRPYDPYYIELKHVAAPFPPADSMPFLQGHADRLGISVHCLVNGTLVVAFPGDRKPRVYDLRETATPPEREENNHD